MKYLDWPEQSLSLIEYGHGSKRSRSTKNRDLVGFVNLLWRLSHGDGLSVLQSFSFVVRQRQSREIRNGQFHRQQAGTGGLRLGIQRQRSVRSEWTDARAAQLLDKSAATQMITNIAGQGTNVGAFAAAYFQI